jgi:hypothetical protein
VAEPCPHHPVPAVDTPLEKEVMDGIGRTAQERGLTPDILESLLNEE